MNAACDLVQTPTGEQLRFFDALPDGFHGQQQGSFWLCPLDTANAAALRQALPWTAPVPVGLRKSIGCGDRLGLATPGHVLAARSGDLFPVLAQQSMRELERTHRTPQQVIDSATWGVFEAHYVGGFGSDADHLKTVEMIDACVDAGFTGFTLDPSAYVDNAVPTDNASTLFLKYSLLPWQALDIRSGDLLRRYQRQTPVGELSSETIYRMACKYSRALVNAATLARHLAGRMAGRPFDLEISIDETDVPTSPAEHYFFVSELRRLGITFQAVAPRFIGLFEKGVDYTGDLAVFERDFAIHARIARELGPYKLSIHTGSDKFSLYPIIARHAGQYVHIKTAGTTWLEALRVIARHKPALFRDLLALALARCPVDRASYYVSADATRIPLDLPDADLPGLLNHFDARQVLHVTFGSLLDHFREAIYAALVVHEEAYRLAVQVHFERHIAPFSG